MQCIRLIFASFCFLITSSSPAAETPYIVSYVYDGDTVKLRNLDGEVKLRLADIDAPERNKAYGKKARRTLIKLCLGSNIIVAAEITGTDKYNRSLGRLHCNHIDTSIYLAEHGLAWHYAQYSSDVSIYNAALKARQQKRGLWKNKNPMPPWAWRQNHPHRMYH